MPMIRRSEPEIPKSTPERGEIPRKFLPVKQCGEVCSWLTADRQGQEVRPHCTQRPSRPDHPRRASSEGEGIHHSSARSPTTQLPTTTERTQEAPPHRQAPATEGPDRLGAEVNEAQSVMSARTSKTRVARRARGRR